MKNDGSQVGAKIATDDKAKSVMIGFSGTHSVSDAKADVNGLKSRQIDGLGSVHKGFYDEYSKVKPQMMQQVQQYAQKGYKDFTITGHSLGGAEAIIAAAEIKKAYPNLNVRVVTAGSPALGNKEFVQNYNNMGISTTRYVVRNKMPSLVCCLQD